jgi:hypothetical protein
MILIAMGAPPEKGHNYTYHQIARPRCRKAGINRLPQSSVRPNSWFDSATIDEADRTKIGQTNARRLFKL